MRVKKKKELQAAHAARHEITIDTITAMLKADRELAREKEQPAAAVSAAMRLAKLHGLIVDKSKMDLDAKATGEIVTRIEIVGVDPGPKRD